MKKIKFKDTICVHHALVANGLYLYKAWGSVKKIKFKDTICVHHALVASGLYVYIAWWVA